MISDRELRAALHRLAPEVGEAGVWDALHRKHRPNPRRTPRLMSGEPGSVVGARSARPKRSFGTVRIASAAALVAVVLVALGFGVHTLVERLSEESSMLVITDDHMGTTEAGSSVSVADSVHRLSYGQTVNIDGLDITVTVMPTRAPFTEVDPNKILSVNGERNDWRLRSQYIVTNTTSETRTVELQRFLALAEDGHRYSAYVHGLELEPGATSSGRLDFYADIGVGASTIAYTSDSGAEDLAVWEPETTSEEPGYPVLKELPSLRVEDVLAVEVCINSPNGGEPLIEGYVPEAADLQAFINVYEQTTLVYSEGYPGSWGPDQIVLFLVGGGQLVIGIGSPEEGHIALRDTRGGEGSHPPSAVGTNSQLIAAAIAMTSASTVQGQGPRLAWGEEAVLDGRTIKVEQPVELPDETVEVPSHMGAPSVLVVAYSLVTITNTGSEPLTCSSGEFSLMGKSSGSSGTGAPEKTLAGHEVLDLVTLQPGESVKAAVRFELEQGDHPVKVLLGRRSSTGYVSSSTNAWLALWQ
jgi:hypothetical protein